MASAVIWMIQNFKSLVVTIVIFCTMVLTAPGELLCQGMEGIPDQQIDQQFQKEVIDSVSSALNEVYVFPEVAKKMEKKMRELYKKGEYKDLTSLQEFTRRLTEDMQAISNDKHLRVGFVPESMRERLAQNEDSLTPEQRKEQFKRLARNNFAFKKIELLPSNIGYLKLDGFNDASYAGATAVAAMNFLANVDALIIDLRENGGGSPSMIQLITSYFYEDPVHLNSFYIRKEDTTQQFWTSSYVPGPRMTDVDLYILTSDYTFSAAEEFTYNLKNLKRATIVGETTGGGAHPNETRFFANLNVGMSLPFGRAINPITGTNWEGVGVEPDIRCPADQALDLARLEALKKISDKTMDADRKAIIDFDIEILKASHQPAQVDESILRQYTGNFGPRRVWFENGNLYYQREDRPVFKLIPMSEDTFMLEGVDYFKMRFVKDDSGNVVEILGMYREGQRDRSPKDKN
jgi:hypothetical protein